ncbi:hypothetical protein FVE85_8251 [Porphyridium purpureum]|uniref:Uncharacterized protein n=1 Tax=Porphyridium purpureum TaxID=35688 RepID=A0A5J4YK14_PORPP|nr:hypothetical protein FVE85_8251 [Porphyridium purpureum]|eukprot:POR7619..scf244_11
MHRYNSRRRVAPRLVLVVLAALLLCCCALVQAVKSKRKGGSFYRAMRVRKARCEQSETCAEGVVSDEDFVPCVLRCLSESCYAEVYESDPLEEGEVDRPRWNRFQSCLRIKGFAPHLRVPA